MSFTHLLFGFLLILASGLSFRSGFKWQSHIAVNMSIASAFVLSLLTRIHLVPLIQSSEAVEYIARSVSLIAVFALFSMVAAFLIERLIWMVKGAYAYVRTLG